MEVKTRTNQPVEGVIEEVNKAIESGEIVAGGTQLYKHTIIFTSSSFANSKYKLYIITDEEEELYSKYGKALLIGVDNNYIYIQSPINKIIKVFSVYFGEYYITQQIESSYKILTLSLINKFIGEGATYYYFEDNHMGGWNLMRFNGSDTINLETGKMTYRTGTQVFGSKTQDLVVTEEIETL